MINSLKIIKSSKDRDKIVLLARAYSNLATLCVTLQNPFSYFTNSTAFVVEYVYNMFFYQWKIHIIKTDKFSEQSLGKNKTNL